jgi:arginine decarboxylase
MTETPILEALVHTVQELRAPLHVPGHKQGRLLPHAFSQWLSVAAKLDLTELPGLDNLQQPNGCIAQSQHLAAQYYGAEHCFYSVNGSSAGIISALLTVAKEGTVLIVGPFHQSVWRGLILADATPILVPPAFDDERWVLRVPPIAQIEAAIKEHANVSAVFVTSPTYTGDVAPIAAIAQLAHMHGIPLIVDEAHGAHFGLHEAFPDHSIHCGADIVVQSVHKMLPGLTQTSWVLQQGPLVSPQRLQQTLMLLQTTSPSYILLASLDVAQAWLRNEGPGIAQETIARLRQWGPHSLWRSDLDPLRHWLPTGSTEVSIYVRDALQRRGIFVEYADAMGVLSIFGFYSDAKMLQDYTQIIAETADECLNTVMHADVIRDLLTLGTPHRIHPRQIFNATVETVSLADASGRVAAEALVPYPPGVPVIYPGQVLVPQAVKTLQEFMTAGLAVLGIDAAGKVAVVQE